MRILIAIDSFKGSLTSLEAGNAVREAILKADKDANIIIKPLADGGEGTTEAFSSIYNVEKIKIFVHNPLMKIIEAEYCIADKIAIIEMASASGITLITPEERNPLETTTFGVGEMIKDAINRGCRKFIIGIGGSATNDGGTGMLSALGFDFLDAADKKISLGAKGLEFLSKVNTYNVIPELKECNFRIACDVKNPLCGENGCSAVFGPQKGATPEMISKMDNWLENFGIIAKTINSDADINTEGAGAAGGLGFAFSAFTNAVLQPGIDIILEESGFEKEVEDADIIVTGEGRLDSQTVMGKAPAGIAKLAKKYNKKVIAFAGCVSDDAEICNLYGIDAYFPIIRKPDTTDNLLNKKNAYKNLTDTAYQVFRLIKLGE